MSADESDGIISASYEQSAMSLLKCLGIRLLPREVQQRTRTPKFCYIIPLDMSVRSSINTQLRDRQQVKDSICQDVELESNWVQNTGKDEKIRVGFGTTPG